MDAKVESEQLCLFDVPEFLGEWHHNDPDVTLYQVALEVAVEMLLQTPEAEDAQIDEC